MSSFTVAAFLYFAVGIGYYRAYGGLTNFHTFFTVVPFWPVVLHGRNTK